MKIVFFGYDQSLDIAQRIMAEGHEIVGIFTFPCDNVFAFNNHIQNFAHHYNIPCITEKITPKDVKFFIDDMDAKLFLSCGYPYKIPSLPSDKVYGINLHPALLPKARGIMPLPFVIMHEPQSAGLTLHKTSENFDQGDILAQHPVSLEEHDTVDTLNAKLGVASPEFVSKTLKNIADLWNNAIPQDSQKATHYNAPNEKMRTLNWNSNSQTISTKMRAFGRFGAFATITNDQGQNQNIIVYQGSTWDNQHHHPLGTLIKSSPREIIIAINNGYVCISEYQII